MTRAGQITGTVLAFAAGLFLGGEWRVDPPVEQAAEQVPAAREPQRDADESPYVTGWRQVVATARAVPEDALLRWIDEREDETGDQRMDDLALHIAAQRLIGVASQAALERIMEGGRYRGRSLMTTWAREDPAGAEVFVRSLKEPERLGGVAGALLSVLARSHPERAMELIGDLHLPDPDGLAGSPALLRTLAEARPDELLERSERWPREWRTLAKAMVAGAWMRADFANGLERMRSLGGGAGLFHKVLSKNPDLGPDMIVHLRHLPAQWRGILFGRMGHLARTPDSPQTPMVRSNPLAWLRAEAGSLGIEEQVLEHLQLVALKHLGVEQREELWELLPSLPEEVQREVVTGRAVSLVRDDQATAEQWVESLSEPMWREWASAAMKLNAPSEIHREEVAWTPALVIQDASEEKYPRGTGSMRSWTAEDGKEALEAFRALERPKQEHAAEKLRTDSVAEMPPALRGEAWRVALEAGTIPRVGTGCAREVIMRLAEHTVRWALQDPAAASEWASTLPRGEERRWVMRNLAAVWAEQGPEEGRAWAAGLDDAAERDMVLEAMR